MALQLVTSVENVIGYDSCTAADYALSVKWNGHCSGSSTYREDILPSGNSFFYNHSNDRYTFLTWLSNVQSNGYRYVYYDFSCETGEQLAFGPITNAFGLFGGRLYNGGLNTLYGHDAVGNLSKVTVANGLVTYLTPPIIPANPTTVLLNVNNGLAVSPEKGLITVAGQAYDFSTFDYGANVASPVRTHRFTNPDSFYWGMGYESSEVCWALFSGSIWAHLASNDNRQTLVKYNYVRGKIELVTDFQRPVVADRMAFIAFDPRRKKLGTLRIKPNDADGAPNNAFEIYSPRPAMARVTVPVNLRPISDDATVPFVSHVMGTKGEAGAMREVNISTSPTASLVKTPKLLTDDNGRVQFTLTLPTAAASETVTVSHIETKVTS